MVPWYHDFQEKTNILAPELLTPHLQLFAMLLVTIWTAMPLLAICRQVSGTEFQDKSLQRPRLAPSQIKKSQKTNSKIL